MSVTSPDIIVIGSRNAGSVSFSWYQAESVWHLVTTDRYGNVDDQISPTPPPADVLDDPNDKSDTVRISIADPAHKAEALSAAKNVAEGIEAYKDYLEARNPNESVIINGKTTTAGAELQRIKNTDFVVTDTPYKNGGVGSAERLSADHNRVEFNYESFDGDGPNDYAHINYQNHEGLVGIIGHEMGHLSDGGQSFNAQSNAAVTVYNKANGTHYSLADVPELWRNNEAYANNYSKGVADAFGMDIDTWAPSEGFSYRDPRTIANSMSRQASIDSGSDAYTENSASGEHDLTEDHHRYALSYQNDSFHLL